MSLVHTPPERLDRDELFLLGLTPNAGRITPHILLTALRARTPLWQWFWSGLPDLADVEGILSRLELYGYLVRRDCRCCHVISYTRTAAGLQAVFSQLTGVK